MADLSKLSDADLFALKAGDLSKVSTEGLMAMREPAAPAQAAKPEPTTAEAIAAHPATRFAVGAASLPLGLLQLGEKAYGGTFFDDKLKTLEAMKKAGGHEGVDAAGLAGAVASPMSVVSKIPLAATAGGKALQASGIGAVAGATDPVTEGDFWSEKAKKTVTGAAVGPLVSGAVSGVAKGAEVARNVVDPWLPGGVDRMISRTVNKAAGDKRQDIIDVLTKQGPTRLPQSVGAGELAAPAGSAEFSGLQRVVEALKPTAYRDMAKTQDAGRVAAVRFVGQDKAALEAAEAARSANAATNYGAAYSQAVRADPELAKLSQNPYFKDALPDALKLAEAKGIDPKTDLTQFLQYVKISLDKAVSRTGDTALSNTEKQAVQSVREQLIGWMGKKNPAFDKARQQFAQDSVPINQMQVGQYLENKLVPALNDSGATANQRGAMYAQAVRDAPGTLKRATGFNRYDDISDVLNPQQTNAVKSVGQDLARKSEYEDLAQRGAPAARELLGDISPKAPAAGMFNPKYSVARAILNRLSGKISGKALDDLAVKMQDPAEMVRLMQMSPPQREKVIEALVQQFGRGATIGAAQY